MTLKVYYLNAGQGDSSYVQLPTVSGETKHMLIDVHLHNDVGIDIIKFLEDYLPFDDELNKPVLDYLVITHPHKDHITGIDKLHEAVYIREMWEIEHDNPNGWGDLYDVYVAVREAIRERDEDAIKTPKAGRYPLELDGIDADIYIFSPSQYINIDDDMTDDEIEKLMHRRCMVLRVIYRDSSLMFTGDSDKDTWEKVTPIYSEADIDGETHNLLDSTILHASHHGSRTFFKKDEKDENPYTESIDKIDPEFVIISVAAENRYEHPHADALQLYENYVGAENVYRTDEDLTIIIEVDEDGNLSIEKDSGIIQEEYQLASETNESSNSTKRSKRYSPTRLDNKPMA